MSHQAWVVNDEAKRSFDIENGHKQYYGAEKRPHKRSGFFHRCCCCIKLTTLLILIFALVIGILIWTKVLWFDKPDVRYVKEESNLGFNRDVSGGYASFDAEVTFQVDNPNKYALKFSDLKVDVFDYQGQQIGTLTHRNQITVPKKGSTRFTMKDPINTNVQQVGGIVQDCIANGDSTTVKAKVHLKARVFGFGVPVNLGPFDRNIKCTGIVALSQEQKQAAVQGLNTMVQSLWNTYTDHNGTSP